jgi:hypothetical protein
MIKVAIRSEIMESKDSARFEETSANTFAVKASARKRWNALNGIGAIAFTKKRRFVVEYEQISSKRQKIDIANRFISTGSNLVEERGRMRLSNVRDDISFSTLVGILSTYGAVRYVLFSLNY